MRELLEQILPSDVVYEIIQFLIPNTRDITFVKQNKMMYNNKISQKYEIAYINEHNIINQEEYYLCRIFKKNNKHRYYITKDIIDCIEVEYNDRLVDIYCYEFHTIFVGKNLEKILLHHFV